MGTQRKRQMSILLPADIQYVEIRETSRVAIGRPDHGRQELTGLDVKASNLHIHGCARSRSNSLG
jgi:hypothetical protein